MRLINRKIRFGVVFILLFFSFSYAFQIGGIGFPVGGDRVRAFNRSSLPSLYTVRIPMYISSNLRVEPEIGFFHTSSNNYIDAGIGVHFLLDKGKSFYIYPGIEGGTEFSFGNGGTYSERYNLFYGTLLIGSEYFLTEKLSIGGEAGFCFERDSYYFSQIDGENYTLYTNQYLYTKGLFIIRWYPSGKGGER